MPATTANGGGAADKQGKCISLILREKICINPICTKPRLRGCMIAGLDRASPFLGNLRGRSVLLLLLHTPVRQPQRHHRKCSFGAYGKAAGSYSSSRRLC